MTAIRNDARLPPQANPKCLKPISPVEVVAGYVASRRDGCPKAEALDALAEFSLAEPALNEAIKARLVAEESGVLRAAQPTTATWPETRRALALKALGDADAGKGVRARADLGAIALRKLYGLEMRAASPSRGEVRCELLRLILLALGDRYAIHLLRPQRSFSFDPMSRRIYLAFAGLDSGTVLEADAALLSSAFNGPAGTLADLSATLIRAALTAGEKGAVETKGAFRLDGFADSVRKLALHLETRPYTGRVAIAQVYDAGLAAGLALGTLDEFKQHLAEAAREGLLDLERYDIAGPLDPNLKERSRLRLGRDERHFIVNQWM
ncbi:hypothetical protein KKP04_08090 [Rhodomicrobium sp. Az07]|uniref:hypothetical protein n=1 Tax=Rhodomicrobium sp. Az07 TaxID=2839034 RepID=UPI001BE8D72A|nr:hypothetical protein [Rhodomicrobium sp. Az07]MBT3070825.1 hypothetical protein [Rhodomicrobium sp. Az07]